MERVLNLDRNERGLVQGNNRGLRLVVNKPGITPKLNPKVQSLTAAGFLRDFEDIVQQELQKSHHCIDLISQELACYKKQLRYQLHILKELWRLVPPSKNREERAVKIMDKISASKEAVQECEERIFAIRQRVVVLEQELYALRVAN